MLNAKMNEREELNQLIYDVRWMKIIILLIIEHSSDGSDVVSLIFVLDICSVTNFLCYDLTWPSDHSCYSHVFSALFEEKMTTKSCTCQVLAKVFFFIRRMFVKIVK